MEQLLNFDGPFDVSMLDQVIETMYSGNVQQVRPEIGVSLIFY